MQRKTGSSEAAEQEAVIQWCDLNRIPIVHIANEGKRSVVYGAALKRAGMRPGFPDLFIPIAANGYHGLFIEMKYGKNKPTQNQTIWLQILKDAGYATCVRYDSYAAINTIKNYIKED